MMASMMNTLSPPKTVMAEKNPFSTGVRSPSRKYRKLISHLAVIFLGTLYHIPGKNKTGISSDVSMEMQKWSILC